MAGRLNFGNIYFGVKSTGDLMVEGVSEKIKRLKTGKGETPFPGEGIERLKIELEADLNLIIVGACRGFITPAFIGDKGH